MSQIVRPDEPGWWRFNNYNRACPLVLAVPPEELLPGRCFCDPRPDTRCRGLPRRHTSRRKTERGKSTERASRPQSEPSHSAVQRPPKRLTSRQRRCGRTLTCLLSVVSRSHWAASSPHLLSEARWDGARLPSVGGEESRAQRSLELSWEAMKAKVGGLFDERPVARSSPIRPAISSTPIEATRRRPRRGSRSWSRWKRWPRWYGGGGRRPPPLPEALAPARRHGVEAQPRRGWHPTRLQAAVSSAPRSAVRKCSRPARRAQTASLPFGCAALDAGGPLDPFPIGTRPELTCR
jgi:hypothetical protein